MSETASPNKAVTVTWVKSAIGYSIRQKRTIAALGLSKLGQTVTRPDNPQVRGMIEAVKHLVAVK
ncbi:MAG TPA: 50S ribosomal protein L30 [Thermoflexales bacterium]|jgi:large subunit ribosomal protein L30|nr:50S ribosomal protein L30 [Anaerolineae bacterium]HQV28642.1 50S ribosomal protein L30 [Thermoflexales bacterium]HQX11176.1 50S ribosomal protein L30 [Thermoflexales bacterium]HQY24233.1 50S ribosomal protein L30 [Thermoflexales bacterium]HQZ53937.1 50S ribosomal protein L30 [Thermoflexales bacterium]